MTHGQEKHARIAARLVPLAFLGAVGTGVAVVLAGPRAILALALGLLLLTPVVWILVSALWPARAERGCPACGRDALARIDPRATHGVHCGACGFRDETRSAWLLAEEEGPLEEIVVAERGRWRARVGSAVDTAAPPD